jgi:hypothetical protein
MDKSYWGKNMKIKDKEKENELLGILLSQKIILACKDFLFENRNVKISFDEALSIVMSAHLTSMFKIMKILTLDIKECDDIVDEIINDIRDNFSKSEHFKYTGYKKIEIN